MTREQLITHIRALNNTEFEALLMKLDMTDSKKDIEDKFREFHSVFPEKTPSGRPLRAKSYEAKRSVMARNLFLKDVTSLKDAEVALKGLKMEIEQRRQKNSMEYMHNLITYVRNHDWDIYYNEEEETPDVSEEQSTFLF